jgi:putative PIG3 family NAD(P)H quinone oxidoreductase
VKAIVLEGFGGPEVMKLGDAEPPTAGPGRVLIRVAATSVNRPDVLQRKGHYPPPPGESSILGLECAGTIEDIGSGVSGFTRGDRVLALLGGGGYAELAAAHADHVLRIPNGMSFAAAACVCEAYITAHMNLIGNARLEDGETVLLHGGGGGVGTAALQICKALRPRTRIFVTTSAAKVERVRALGADRAIDYRHEDFAEVVLKETGGRGADVILDHIGASYLARNVQALAIGGRLALIGVLGGRKAELDLARVLTQRLTIVGSVLRPRSAEQKAALVRAFAQDVLPHLASGRIAPLIHRVYPLAAAAEAHRAMEAGEHFGKLVLSVSEGALG